MDSRLTRLLPHISLGASAVMLGMSFVAIRVIMEDVHAPATLGFLRYGLAVLMLLPLLVWSRRVWPPAKIFAVLVVLGVAQFGLFHLFVNTALQQIPASRGAVIFSLIPIMTMLISAMVGRDRLSGMKVCAALLSVVGVSLAIGEKAFLSDTENTGWTGELLFFLAVCCGATYNSFFSQILKAHAITLPTIISMTAGCLAIFPVALAEGFTDIVSGYSGNDWLWILYLAGPAAAFSLFLFNWGLQQLSPSGAAIYVPLAPVAATAFGATLLNEHLSSYFILGLAFAVAGPLLVNWRRQNR